VSIHLDIYRILSVLIPHVEGIRTAHPGLLLILCHKVINLINLLGGLLLRLLDDVLIDRLLQSAFVLSLHIRLLIIIPK
jgi:hypothetical protein